MRPPTRSCCSDVVEASGDAEDDIADDDVGLDTIAAAVCPQGAHHVLFRQPLSSCRCAHAIEVRCASVPKCNRSHQRPRFASAERTKHWPSGSPCLCAAATASASSAKVCTPPRRRSTKYNAECFCAPCDDTTRPSSNCLPAKRNR